MLTCPPLRVRLQGALKQSISARLADAALASASLAIADSSELAASSGIGASLAGKASLAVSAAGAARQTYLLRTLNGLQLCVTYTPRLWARASEEIEGSFAGVLPASALDAPRAQLAAAAAALGEFESTLADGVGQLAASLLPRLRPRLDAFASASYVLATEAEFAAAKNDSFVAPFCAELEACIRPLQPALADAAREAVLQRLLQS